MSSADKPIECEWQGCKDTFTDPEVLYVHLCNDHVGRKSTNNLCLTCHWKGCEVTCVKRDHITSHLRGESVLSFFLSLAASGRGAKWEACSVVRSSRIADSMHFTPTVHTPLKPHSCEVRRSFFFHRLPASVVFFPPSVRTTSALLFGVTPLEPPFPHRLHAAKRMPSLFLLPPTSPQNSRRDVLANVPTIVTKELKFLLAWLDTSDVDLTPLTPKRLRPRSYPPLGASVNLGFSGSFLGSARLTFSCFFVFTSSSSIYSLYYPLSPSCHRHRRAFMGC